MGTWGFLGMHLFWWLFWLMIIVGFTSMFTPVPKDQAKHLETPLGLLQRRYAAGEVSTEEYEQRRAVLGRDSGHGG
ncbi:MAG: SHOCT domain-containing protein [Longimicrobiales bacterium]